jgi:hypothetical protein
MMNMLTRLAICPRCARWTQALVARAIDGFTRAIVLTWTASTSVIYGNDANNKAVYSVQAQANNKTMLN